MSLVDTYPERFGWKYWNLAVDHGLLVSPHKQLSFSGPRIDARCIHGNVAPSTECQCGIHYVPRFSDIDRWTKCSTQSTGPMRTRGRDVRRGRRRYPARHLRYLR
jgi:hypothetical protein